MKHLSKLSGSVPAVAAGPVLSPKANFRQGLQDHIDNLDLRGGFVHKTEVHDDYDY